MDRENLAVPVSHQLALLQVNRSWYYDWLNRGCGEIISPEDLFLMNRIDWWYTRHPFFGRRKITEHIREYDHILVNHKRIDRLMTVMGLEALYQKPNLSKPNKENEIYPYLLKGLKIDQPNQVHGTDITYIRMHGSFIYLVATIDWFSRYVLSWDLSDSLQSDFCIANLQKSLTVGIPQIHNSDQGVQFTSKDYLGVLKQHPVRISMDGRGRAMDNIFTERLWRTVKYEEVYLKDYGSPREARESLTDYFNFYNEERLHQSLGYKTPAQIYFRRR